MPAAHKSVDQLKKPSISLTFTADELKRFRIAAAQADTPLKLLAEKVLIQWLDARDTPKAAGDGRLFPGAAGVGSTDLCARTADTKSWAELQGLLD